jgi:protein-S-isoprenylcysteine O-methyltransferase Ste14
MTQSSWYKGPRGEWYVVVQVALIALVFLGPRGGPAWEFPRSMFGTGGGLLLFLAGVSLLVAGIFSLRKNLTPLPCPSEKATLIETGPYRIVRHPMYGGGILIALGWALLVHSWLTIGYALILFIFIHFKSRREERWLVEKFPRYADYQKRVRKLIPFVN